MTGRRLARGAWAVLVWVLRELWWWLSFPGRSVVRRRVSTVLAVLCGGVLWLQDREGWLLAEVVAVTAVLVLGRVWVHMWPISFVAGSRFRRRSVGIPGGCGTPGRCWSSGPG